MINRHYSTPLGTIQYWVNEHQPNRPTLVLLPGLTADHRLFNLQVAAFESRYNLLLWDAPGHHLSRPFELHFTMTDMARWLHDIILIEHIEHPVLVGQSMGGYISQTYMQHFPGKACGFISIDSAPLQRQYMAGWEIWMLKHTELMYKWYPWKALLRDGSKGCAETDYGRRLMREMMQSYSHRDYAVLASYGYRLLAEAVELNLPYEITCPALLLCGDKDAAGSAKRYNKEWSQRTGLPLIWVPNAGHNSNTDSPKFINEKIQSFIEEQIIISN